MKQIKRAFAMLLCVAMVLSLCMTFAVAAEIPRYDTLDAIPEDVNIFRSIRTGQMSHVWINGNSYWQFSEQGYPTVRIKASAFMTVPTNNYLIADNLALSQNCKNANGTSRVCYFKKMSSSVSTNLEAQIYSGTSPRFVQNDVYTTSIYRLELKADADFDNKIEVGAKLTSGVTFDYDTGKAAKYALTRRTNKVSVRPSVSVLVANASQDVRFKKYSITDSFGDYSATISSGEAWNIGAGVTGCAASIAGVFLEPELIGKVVSGISAAATCIPTAVAGVQYSAEKGYYSPYPVDYQELVTFPIKLASSENHVTAVYELNCGFNKSNTDFMIMFGFN